MRVGGKQTKTLFCSRLPWETQSCSLIMYRDLCYLVSYECITIYFYFFSSVSQHMFAVPCSDFDRKLTCDWHKSLVVREKQMEVSLFTFFELPSDDIL